jgi:hypothetical protein
MFHLTELTVTLLHVSRSSGKFNDDAVMGQIETDGNNDRRLFAARICPIFT